MGLQEAREKAFHTVKVARSGGDPTPKRIPTIGELGQTYVELHSPTWSKGTHAVWIGSLENHIYPDLAHKRADQVTVDDCLNLILSKSSGTQGTVRQRLRCILDVAVAKRLIEFNPAGEALNVLIPKQNGNQRKHFDALDYKGLPEFMGRLRSQPATVANLALQFVVLTALRHNEVRGARWSEIDLGNAVWVIPAERMKGRKAHTVPLPPAAVAILKALPRKSELVFPNRTGAKPISGTVLTNALRKITDQGTLHGFRTSFRMWAAEQTEYSRELAEHALSHAVGSVIERSYQRSTLVDQRRELMNDWADFLK